ncbi:MAG: L-serine ammonia-lyase [bacterium]
MTTSVFDLFKVGIGPSSSHTVGPMRAAARFLEHLHPLGQVKRVQVELYGSLGLTGKGHGSDKAVLLGLEGEDPTTVDTRSIPARMEAFLQTHQVLLGGSTPLPFHPREDLVFHRRKSLPFHPNGLLFRAFDSASRLLVEKTYYSVGGGFVIEPDVSEPAGSVPEIPFPFSSAEELLQLCQEHRLSISEVMLRNEASRLPEAEVRHQLGHLWEVMQACVEAGCAHEGELPGGLRVPRRAPALHRQLLEEEKAPNWMEWVNLYALAVNEENAAGGRVVTAPTNGAAGIIPAVLHYLQDFTAYHSEEPLLRFLLTAGAIGSLYKENASISGAEVGCQGEVGVACSMAAGALAEALGGTPEQAENAAEIAMEHNLGLTCDPIGGLVQIPCIERNAIAANKAINAARLALRADGRHYVSLDKVIRTMRQTGEDMHTKYKETSRGGLAVNIVEC